MNHIWIATVTGPGIVGDKYLIRTRSNSKFEANRVVSEAELVSEGEEVHLQKATLAKVAQMMEWRERDWVQIEDYANGRLSRNKRRGTV